VNRTNNDPIPLKAENFLISLQTTLF